MAIGMRVSIVVVAFAFVMAWKFLPARARDHVATPVQGDVGVDTDEAEEPVASSVAVAPPATATLSAGD
jgi:hypothetical protein